MTRQGPFVIDATLREGMQTRAGAFTPGQCLDIARAAVRCGVDMLECGHPSASAGQAAGVRAVVEAGLGVPVLAHARARRDDIAAVRDSGADWVGIFLGVSDLSRRTRTPGRSIADILGVIEQSVTSARSLGLSVRFTIEDASRTPGDLLRRAASVAEASGAGRLCLADTVGLLEPRLVAPLVDKVRTACPEIPLEVHLHDDRGLAQANALAAVDAGVSWISSSINGLGERAGIVDTVTLLVNLAFAGHQPYPDGNALQEASRLVAAHSRSAPDDRRPIVGAHVFHHAAPLHGSAVGRDPNAYEWIDPKFVGRSRTLGGRELPDEPSGWIVKPEVISSTELPHHRRGVGERYVLIDDRFVPDARQYCIARRIPEVDDTESPELAHVDSHVHACDSLFVFLGTAEGYGGLEVEVALGDETFEISSPASVFIPAGIEHKYRILRGEGTYINHVLAGRYAASLLEPGGSA